MSALRTAHLEPAGHRRRTRHVLTIVLAAAVVAGAAICIDLAYADAASRSTASASTTATATATFTYKRVSSPPRTLVYNSSKRLVATFTDGSRTVNLVGPSRTFRETEFTTYSVSTTAWVRLLPAPFTGRVSETWLSARLSDTSPDLLAIAFQYVVGAAPMVNAVGVQYAGDAAYWPLAADGSRIEGSDFNDYLGLAWTYPTVTDAPEADQFRSLDCSGFARMVFGYRLGVPLSLRPDGGVSMPRRAFEQEAAAPGITVIANRGVVPSSRTALLPGDLVFFDASTDDGTQIDHVGIFLGKDSAGNDRFISSRKTANGPTMGDLAGRSVLNGTGLYATGFRSARRI